MANTALFNAPLFNSNLWNGGQFNIASFSSDTLVFNGYSLSDGTDIIMQTLRYSGPSRELITGNIPRGDGMYLTGDYFRENIIEASGIVQAASASALRTLMDTVRKNLRVREANLDITEANGTVKRFLATLTNYDELFADQEHYHITYVPFVAKFACKTPFGKARTYTSNTITITTSPTNETMENLGTIKAQPVFTLIFNSASSVTAVSVENTTTGETITYTGSIAANDVLAFDSEMKAVTLNGTAVDYSGTFPSLEPGSNVVSFTITGTSYSAVTTVKHKSAWL